MKAIIRIFDKDYNAYIGYETIDVKGKSEAMEYCKTNSWSGENYIFVGFCDEQTKETRN